MPLVVSEKYLTFTLLMVFHPVLGGVSWVIRVRVWVSVSISVGVRVSVCYLKKNFIVVSVDSFCVAVC